MTKSHIGNLPLNCRGSSGEPSKPVPVPRDRCPLHNARACGARRRQRQSLRWNFFAAARFLIAQPLPAGIAAVAAMPAARGQSMLNLVVTLLIIALIAAVLGFGGIASAAVGIAKVVFLVALLLFVVAAIAGTMRTV
jgi:uncharacterized membrane protein YtjA (UPF0391 family)